MQTTETPTADTLERLYRRIDELESELRLVGSTIQYLERALGDRTGDRTNRELDRAYEERQYREITQEVRADLFAEDLQNMPEEHE